LFLLGVLFVQIFPVVLRVVPPVGWVACLFCCGRVPFVVSAFVVLCSLELGCPLIWVIILWFFVLLSSAQAAR
jgi:hypothetical protein